MFAMKGIMSLYIEYLKRNITFVLLAFSMIAGATAIIPFNTFIYYVGIVFLIYNALKNSEITNRLGTCYILYLTVCVLSSCFALILDYRLFAFIVLIISCTPITNSYRLYVFREKYLYHCLMIFPVVAVASIYCYFADINYYVQSKSTVNFLDFSAFFPHPLWLGAALGIANVVLVWLIFYIKNYSGKILFFIILLLSIYVSVVAASRSAFFSSVIAMVTLIIIRLHNIKKILLMVSIIILLTIVFLPIYLTGAARMQDKFDSSRGKYGSRTELVTSGLANFRENPLFGQGFAISHNAKGEKIVGRMESGSGWLSILFQTGIVGFVLVCILLLKTIRIFPYIVTDNKLLLYFCSFLYLCLHSGFEGYILTVGYYPCILFWTLLGFLHVYPYYKIVKNKYEIWQLKNG